LVQDVLRDLDPVEAAPPAQAPPAEAPVILPLHAARPRRPALRRYASLAAACLLFGCLTLLPATNYVSVSARSEDPAVTTSGGEASGWGADAWGGVSDQVSRKEADRGRKVTSHRRVHPVVRGEGYEARVGVFDGGGLFTPEGRTYATRRLRE